MSSPASAFAQTYHSPANSYHSPSNSSQFGVQTEQSPLTLNTAVTFPNRPPPQVFRSASQPEQSTLHRSPSSARSSPTNSAAALPTTDEEWAKVADAVERRRVQNRNAQRKYRKKCKRRAEELERRKQAGTFVGHTSTDSTSNTPINRSRYSTPNVGSSSRTSSVPALRHHESTGSAASMHSMRSFTPQMDGQFNTFRHRSNSIAVMPTTEIHSHSASTSDVLYPWLASNQPFSQVSDASFSPDNNAMCFERASSAFPDMFPISSLPSNTYTDFSTDSSSRSSSHGRSSSDNSMSERAQSMPPEISSAAAAPSTGRTMLHLAAAKGNRAMLTMLLQKGGDPNIKDCYGYTPLHLAVEGNHHECADLLIDSGANIFATTELAAATVMPTAAAAAAATSWLTEAAAMTAADPSGHLAMGSWPAPESNWAKTEMA